MVESPSHLREISVERRKEDDDDDAPPDAGEEPVECALEQQLELVAVQQSERGRTREFLDSEPSLSAKSISHESLSSGNTKNRLGDDDHQRRKARRYRRKKAGASAKENEAQQQQNQPQLRQSRRQKHQPQRLGDLLEWNDIKSNALYEKYDPEREQRLLEQVQMEKEKLRRIEEEEKNKNTTTTTGTTASSHNRRTSGGKKKLAARAIRGRPRVTARARRANLRVIDLGNSRKRCWKCIRESQI